MRNFREIDEELKLSILEKHRAGNLKFAELEVVYNITKESFRDFLINEVRGKFEEEYPTPPRKFGFFSRAISLVEKPQYNTLFSFVLSILFFIGFYHGQFVFQSIGIDPIFNLLFSSIFGAAALFIIITTVAQNLTFFSDVENFLYFLTGKEYSIRDYKEDINNGLTTYERCYLNQRNRFYYFFLFVFLYYIIVRTYPTATEVIF